MQKKASAENHSSAPRHFHASTLVFVVAVHKPTRLLFHSLQMIFILYFFFAHIFIAALDSRRNKSLIKVAMNQISFTPTTCPRACNRSSRRHLRVSYLQNASLTPLFVPHLVDDYYDCGAGESVTVAVMFSPDWGAWRRYGRFEISQLVWRRPDLTSNRGLINHNRLLMVPDVWVCWRVAVEQGGLQLVARFWIDSRSQVSDNIDNTYLSCLGTYPTFFTEIYIFTALVHTYFCTKFLLLARWKQKFRKTTRLRKNTV